MEGKPTYRVSSVVEESSKIRCRFKSGARFNAASRARQDTPCEFKGLARSRAWSSPTNEQKIRVLITCVGCLWLCVESGSAEE
jgi:hypothetical protein